MKIVYLICIAAMIFVSNAVLASPNAMKHYLALTNLQGEWKLAPVEAQEGKATTKGPAAKMLGTDQTAMVFKVIGKGSTVQENLLPGTGKEMATMYHCNNFKQCAEVKATHYCAKQNQPELLLDAKASSSNHIQMVCNEENQVCNSAEGHVHKISHELSDGDHLKTTYTIYKDGKFEYDTIYHFVKK